jgi:polar amino acid transport system substrate-binding protein
MKKFYIFVITLILLVITTLSWAGVIERIQAKGEITVSLNRGYPPFAMEKDGKIFGLDVDLAHLLADYLDVKVKFIRPKTYDRQIPKLLSGESDIIIAAMTRTVKRGLRVSFSDPYFEVSQAALVRRDLLSADADSYFDLPEIEGLRLGVKADTTHEKFARQLFLAKAIKPYPTAAAAAEALINGDVDAMVADSPFVQVWRNTHLEHYQKIAALLTPVTREYYAFAIRPGDPAFLNWLNLFIDQIKIDGTLDLLAYEYFEQMSWAQQKSAPEKRLNRAQLLKNKFITRKQAEIDRRRRQFQGTGDKYE